MVTGWGSCCGSGQGHRGDLVGRSGVLNAALRVATRPALVWERETQVFSEGCSSTSGNFKTCGTAHFLYASQVEGAGPEQGQFSPGAGAPWHLAEEGHRVLSIPTHSLRKSSAVLWVLRKAFGRGVSPVTFQNILKKELPALWHSWK